MYVLSCSLIILSVIMGLKTMEYEGGVRNLLRHKVIPLEDYYPECEPNTICQWAVCPWNRDPELILSRFNCLFYKNHQCNRCPENYECQNTNEKEVESSFVTFEFRCLPV